jgi:GT2 family glycosyltransferase
MTTAPRKPELSIIIVSYNTLQMTRECLASIFSNTSDLSLEVIVVDNNSHDGSVNMIRNEFSQVKIISNKENRGFAAANNQGFSLCRSDYILLLNSDTIVLGQALQASLAHLKNHPEAGAMGCRILNTDLSVQASCSGYPTLPRLLLMTSGFDRISTLSFLDHYLMRHWPRDNERKVEVISGCFLLFRREILNQVGGFDENFFFFAEETDWCRRIREAGWSLNFAPVGDIVHHGGG